jgi:ribulose-phosphate 3-epimerase
MKINKIFIKVFFDMIKISPSILSANFARLGEDAKKMQTAGADMLHIDVMDGHFVPNITIGAPVVKSLKPETSLPLDVHLMIDNPEKYIEDFIKAGADIITFHIEATKNADALIDAISKRGVKPSISIKPNTSADTVFPYLDKLTMVLVMTVEPGFGGQALIEDTLIKVQQIRNECNRRNIEMDIQVDGGITTENIGRVAKMGANVFVAGSAIFNSSDPAATIKLMHEANQC